MRPHDIKKIVNTIKYLRSRQILYQLYYRYLKRFRIVKFNSNLALRPWSQKWNAPVLSTPTISSTGEIDFLGELAPIDCSIIWNDTNRSKLWLYNLHYFDYFNSYGADSHTLLLNSLLDKWIDENLPGEGTGWEPYPLSLRIVNLIKWFSKQPDRIKPDWLVSLADQAEALLQQIEYHILANHLFVNAKALVFAGIFFQGSRADVFLKKGLNILDREINEQFLEDGGHFELSPMYHASLLWDLCDLVNLAERTGLPELQCRQSAWRQLIVKSMNWLNLMVHPDGDISFFNDAAFNIAPTFDKLADYTQQLKMDIQKKHKNPEGISLHCLKESGYCVVQIDHSSKAILDVAKIGPDYQPGHAHADILSFELSLFGQRFLVNSGTSTYAMGKQRQYERSTKAHNTVNIDGENSSEIWGGFRVARRAYPEDFIVSQSTERVSVGCSHNGYLRLAGRNIHRREWIFSRQAMIINDNVRGKYNQAESRLFFHPEINVAIVELGLIQCHLPDGQSVLIKITGSEQILLEPSTWHPCFGSSRDNICLIVKFEGSGIMMRMEW